MKRITISLLAVIAAVVTGCNADRDGEPSPLPVGSSGVMALHVSVSVPSPAFMLAAGGDIVSDFAVMLFADQGDGIAGSPGKLVKVLMPDNLDVSASGTTLFDVKFKVTDDMPQNLVLIALSDASRYMEAIREAEHSGATFDELAALLVDSYGDRCLRQDESGIFPITLWGKASRVIDTSLHVQNVSLALLRDMAMIDVAVADPLRDDDLLRLASVQVYNGVDGISLMPLPQNLAESGDAEAPTVPSVSGMLGVEPAKAAQFDDNPVQVVTYSPEQRCSDVADPLMRPAVIIGAYYKGSRNISYYRVDIADNGKFADILRNHRYMIRVTDVGAPGSDTPDEAYRSAKVGVDAVVIPWTDFSMDAAFDGRDYLAMSREVTLGSGAGSISELSVKTNVPESQWTICWAETGADPATAEYGAPGVFNPDPSGWFGISVSGHGSDTHTIIFTTFTSLPDEMTMRSRQLFIRFTNSLSAIVNIVQSQGDTGSDGDEWDDGGSVPGDI